MPKSTNGAVLEPPTVGAEKSKVRRYTIDFGEKFDKLLTDLAASEEVSKSEVIRRAVAYYAFLRNQTAIGNRKISVTDEQDRVIKDVALP